jgi:choline dehydrogenase-like flavoprotein
MKVCVIGSGISGGVLAAELAETMDVIIVDTDSLKERWKDTELKVMYADTSPTTRIKTFGFGFGGTSNLWHGVLTQLDEDDYTRLEKLTSIKFKEEFAAVETQVQRYISEVNHFSRNEKLSKNPNKLLDSTIFEEKLYLIPRRPFRTRTLVRKLISKKNVKVIQSSVAVSLIVGEGIITGLRIVNAKGEPSVIKADTYVLSCGAIESARLLSQSFVGTTYDNHLIGNGLMDHPVCLLGEIHLPRLTMYRGNGVHGIFSSYVHRYGYTIRKEFRKNSLLNHSIQLTPLISSKLAITRSMYKDLLYSNDYLGLLVKIVSTPNLPSLLLGLLVKKMGIGIPTRRLLVSMQSELIQNEGRYVAFTENKDRFGRFIPCLVDEYPSELESEADNLKKLVENNLQEKFSFSKYKTNISDFLCASHNSGTCRMGNSKIRGVVDSNLKYFDMENLYVCDASVLPVIGNSNLGLTLINLACRLANHLRIIAHKQGIK